MQQNRFIVFGTRECHQAIEAGNANRIEIEEVYFCTEILDTETHAWMLESVPSEKLIPIPKELAQKLEFGDRQVGLVVVSKRPENDLGALHVSPNSLTLVLESIEKPGNIGAVLRSCDGAGVDTLILASPLADFFNPNCIRASLGAVFTTQLGVGTTLQVQEFLQKQQFQCYSAMPDATIHYREAKYDGARCALILGNEAQGLSQEWKGSKWNPVFYPDAWQHR